MLPCGNYLLDQLVQGLRRSVEEEVAGPLVPVVRRLADQNRIDRLISYSISYLIQISYSI